MPLPLPLPLPLRGALRPLVLVEGLTESARMAPGGTKLWRALAAACVTKANCWSKE